MIEGVLSGILGIVQVFLRLLERLLCSYPLMLEPVDLTELAIALSQAPLVAQPHGIRRASLYSWTAVV